MKNTSMVWWVALVAAAAACGKKGATEDASKTGAGAGGAGATGTKPADTSGTAEPKTASGGAVADLPIVTDCPKSIGGGETVARTIPKGCGPIVVVSDWYLDGSLTIEAGVTFKFQENVEAVFGRNGTTKVTIKGTADQPVLMTSAGDAVAGYWRGIGLFEGTSRSRIENLVLEHVGDQYGAIRLKADDITVKGLVVRDAKAIGLYLDDNVKLTELSGSTFDKAGKIAASVSTAAVAGFQPGNKFDNGAFVEIRGGHLEDSAKWQNPGAPYVVRAAFDVKGKNGKATLEIAAGTELRFDAGVDLDVGYGNPGALVVSGTAEKPVTFTASDAAQPWKGIWLYNSADAKIDHAGFSGAGADENRGAILVDSSSTLSLTNSSFKANKLGVTVSNEGKIKAFEKNAFDAADKPALALPASEVGNLGAGNAFASGAHIQITAGKVKTKATWAPQTVPYEASEEISVDEKGQLTLQPGVDIVFASGTQLSVGYSDEASLKAAGSGDKPIHLHGAHDEPGAWKGVFFYEHARDSELSNARIEDTGGEAGVTVRDDATVKVADIACAKCEGGAVTSTCKAKLTLGTVKAESGTPKDVVKPEGCQ